MKKRYVILDRDGTVMLDKHYLADPAGVELAPGAIEGLGRLRDLDLGLVLITNQSGVGRGYFDETSVAAIHERLSNLLAPHGIAFAGVYICPHTPEQECGCRKPRPGMVEQAARELGFEPRDCFVIGDKECDVGLGRAVGATTILVRTGKGAAHEARCRDQGLVDYVADDLAKAAETIAGLLS